MYFSLSLSLGRNKSGGVPSLATYLRPDGTSLYKRPDGTSNYNRP